MSSYLASELNERRIKIIAIIPAEDLWAIYTQVRDNPTRSYSIKALRAEIMNSWNLYAEAIQNWTNAAFEGF